MMKRFRIVLLTLALAGWLAVSMTARAQFADSVLSYDPGSGFAAGFTNTSSALGAPASGSGVTPFAPPFSKNQLLSIGAGGEVTVQMDTPILNDSTAPFGLNFIIFANSFFVQNGGSGQTATTGGTLFYHPASTIIQVSPDDVNWYTLNTALAPQPGQWFPTYGAGDPQLPVDPALANMNLAGMTLGQIEALYGGSAGGTGFSLSWAQDSAGNNVDLASADYVRIEVLSGVLDMDAISAVPEPGTWALILAGGAVIWFWSARVDLRRQLEKMKNKYYLVIPAVLFLCSFVRAGTITENFSTDPLQNGWAVFGDTNLFQWNAANENLDVTWDSSQSNSYFYHPLGTTLGKADAFSVDFDIQLNDLHWTNTFQLAVGLLNFTNATDPGFSRPQGYSPNIFEFDYFPDSGDGFGDPNIAASMTDAAAITNFPDFYFVYDTLPMTMGVTYHVTVTHAAGDGVITGTVFTNGQVYTTMPIVGNTGGEVIGDFALDTVCVINYSGAGQDPSFAGSILAHGTVDNFVVTLPPPVRNLAGTLSNNVWQVQFNTYSNWVYTLQRSTDLSSWNDASMSIAGSGDTMSLSDTNALANHAFYRVRSQQP